MDYEVTETKCAFPGQAFINKLAKIYCAQPGSALCQAWERESRLRSGTLSAPEEFSGWEDNLYL